MEWIGRLPDTVHSSLHAHQFDTSGGYKAGGFSDDFHTYAANWQPDYIEFLVDNKVFKRVNQSDSAGNWPFAE